MPHRGTKKKKKTKNWRQGGTTIGVNLHDVGLGTGSLAPKTQVTNEKTEYSI